MAEHPIQGLMRTSMENIKKMVEVNTIVGDPIHTPDGSVVLPISKVGFGFAAGGSEFNTEHSDTKDTANHGHTSSQQHAQQYPFGGGSGGGVSITPIAFLVVGTHGVKIVSLDHQTHLVERMIDSIPQVMDKYKNILNTKETASGTHEAVVETSGAAQPEVF